MRLSLSAVWWAALLLTAPAFAHPHGWIDLRVTALFDRDGRVSHLQQQWKMDPMTSVFLIEELARDPSGVSREQKMAATAERLLTNIAEHNYFTALRHGDRPVDGFTARNPELKQVKQRLVLHFELVLGEPIDPVEAPLRYAVFDPTYYIEVLHAESDSIRLTGSPARCDLRLRAPRPDPILVARAAALGVDQRGDPDLGQHFAEWAEIRCDSIHF